MTIELAHIDFAYDGSSTGGEEAGKQRQIFRDFSYVFEEGKIHCVMGPSGCGKTTLLKLLSGRLTPQYGSVRSTSGHSQQRLFRGEVLSLTQENA